MRNIIVLFFLAGISLASGAQDFNRAKMDSLFSLIEQNQKGMGSLSICRNGQEIYHRSIGWADLEKGIKASSSTRYRIGSISKSFTAVVILQLVQERKLNLDTKLAVFFPQLPNADKITIEMLLRHRSGLYNFTNATDYTRIMTSPITREGKLALFVKNGTVFQPDERTEYSNTNFEVLAMVAEEIEKKSFHIILEERIIKPLGLKNTTHGGKIDPASGDALSYTKIQGWKPAPETDLSLATGAGAIVSTAYDINMFYIQLFQGNLVADSSLRKMRKMKENLGMGLMQSFYKNKKYQGHNGGIDGFQSRAAYFSDDNLAVTYLSNAVEMNINEVFYDVLAIYFGTDFTLPVFTSENDSVSSDLGQYTGSYKCPNFPLEIEITEKEKQLIGQATGQGPFTLTAYALHKFKFEPSSLTLEFIPPQHKMILRQYGGTFEFTRK
ncbi:MAG: serine hydrolase domain-containing protein [Bacteroidales bacterium]